MQAQLERIPPEYFDTTKGHILRKNAQRSRKKKHLKRRKAKKVTSREERRESCKLALIVVLNVLLCMCLAAYILWRLSIKVDVVVCPHGYFGEKCERNDFVDSTPWESAEVFKAANGECTNGYSFRTWAPGALTVNLWVRKTETGESQHYSMVEQDYGYWFISVCDVSINDRYKYQLIYKTSNGYVLSLGGLQRTPLNQEGYNVIVDTAFDWQNQTADVVPFPALPIVYHIHLPTYNHSMSDSPFATVSSRIETLKHIGVNVIELNGLEYLYCNGNDITCWDESSYSPGLLRPSLGSVAQLKELVFQAHANGMAVVLDLDWESSKRDSLLWDYHNYFLFYQEETATPEIADIFRDTAYCSMAECPFDLAGNNLMAAYLLAVLRRYRAEYHIDGVRWISRACNRFMGGDCSAADKPLDEAQNEAAVSDLWREIRAMGLTILTDKKYIVPDSDYFIDISFSHLVSSVTSTTGLSYSLLMNLIHRVNTSSADQLHALEYYERLSSRLLPRSSYKIASTVLSLFYILPLKLHFFMGTPYLSDVPFTSEPSPLDLDEVGCYVNGVMNRPRSKFPKYKMTQDIYALRKSYVKENTEVQVVRDDQTQKILVLRVGPTTNPLLVVINYGSVAYPNEESSYFLRIPLFQPSKAQMPWKLEFTTCNSEYESSVTTIQQDLYNVDCEWFIDYRYFACYRLIIGDQTLSVYSQ